MTGKSVLLIVGGGIAAFKALELVRRLRKAGVAVRPILTEAGAQFVTPLSLGALAEQPVRSALFSLTDEHKMGHIELSRAADLVVVAPATADLMAKAAHGHASDLASTVLLATDKPVLMAPAMNVRMWRHPATQRNLEVLTTDGVRFVGPEDGAMACGEFGPGRMAEPEAIFDAVMGMLATRRSGEGVLGARAAPPLAGRRALVTAGPTLEPIDPVRFLSNRSSGKQGYAVAKALADLGAAVTLVSGPTALDTPAGVERIGVETADQMLAACEAALPVDVAVMVAAVADWKPAAAAGHKLKKDSVGAPALDLAPTPDILASLSRPGPGRPRLVIGFAAETRALETHALAKLKRKGCDLIVANDVSGDVMGGPENAVSIVGPAGVERWPRMPKAEVAHRLAALIADRLSGPSVRAGDTDS
jgi:phosphopantothenoylcysteine decarboxylase/phosphopantothenate--cysteine ligase